jgi:hypothetical protein
MNYTTKSAVPTVHITKKKSRLKVYNGNNIFLNDGDNFEFELHNPTTKSVLVRIKLNGGYISTSGVIVKPGQRVFLERFLDSNNKFEYSTYNVKDTSENRSAIDLNGDIRIEFYNQQDIQIYPHLNGGNWYNGWTSINTGTPRYNSVYYNTTNTASISGTLTSTSNTTLLNCSNTFESSSPKSKKSIETGRVEKGVKSTQDFIASDETFSSLISKHYQFKILPLSQKNKTSDELRQYCTECGTKVKSKYKFCPSCGSKI